MVKAIIVENGMSFGCVLTWFWIIFHSTFKKEVITNHVALNELIFQVFFVYYPTSFAQPSTHIHSWVYIL